MICRLISISLLVFALAGSATLAQSKSDSKTESASRENNPPLIKLKFAGGNAADYVEAVRKAAGGLNVYVAPEAKAVPMPPIELNNVTSAAALGILHGRMVTGDGTKIQLSFEEGGTFAEGEQPIFSIQAMVGGRPAAPPTSNRVWAVSGVLATGVKAEDLLTAIQTSLDLLGQELPSAQIRFHEATGILIARASVEQLNAIQEVVESVFNAASQRQASPDEQLNRLKSENAQLRQRVVEVESELRKLKERPQ